MEGKKIRVIVAEDVEILRKNLIRQLNSDADIQVVGEASSGAGIVAVASEVDFDIVILDIEMETSTAGIVAGGQILALNKDIKIIFLSVHEDDNIVYTAMEIGAIDYMIKTAHNANLIEHIKRAYENKVQMQWNVQNKLKNEFLRLRKSQNNIILFVRNLSLLTEAERELIRLIYEGNTLREISKIRFVELTTIKTQVSHIIKKMGVSRTKEIIDQLKQHKVEYLLYN